MNDHLPYMVVRGNHDNPSKVDFFGSPVFPANQPRGLRDYFGPQFYMDQQARYSSGPRQFKVLSINNKLLGYAFQFKLGARQDINVLGLDDFGSAWAWARDFLTANPTRPAIVLSHQGLYRPTTFGTGSQISQVWESLIEPQMNQVTPFAKQIFMAVQGHITQNTQNDITIGDNLARVLRIQRDNQVDAPILPAPPVVDPTSAGYMTAVRFYLDTNEVEVVTVSAHENRVLVGPGFALPKHPFTIPRFTN